MPLITQEMIESLRQPSGFSRFSLYLLGAVPLSHKVSEPLPPESEWFDRVLCSKISPRRLAAIKHQAKWLRIPYRKSYAGDATKSKKLAKLEARRKILARKIYLLKQRHDDLLMRCAKLEIQIGQGK